MEEKKRKPGTFKKNDPRINRNGRPKSFDELRKLAQELANEKIVSSDGTTAMTRIELILRQWATDKDPRKQLAFIEYAFGKVPANIDLTSKGESITPVQIIEVVKDHGE